MESRKLKTENTEFGKKINKTEFEGEKIIFYMALNMSFLLNF